jgi:hypothetical protein
LSVLSIPTKKYVYYDESGNIKTISNQNTASGNYIEVEKTEVEDILSGKEPHNAYVVLYDTLDKKYKLMHKNINQRSWVSILDSIYQIPLEANENYDIKIAQNNKEYYWEVSLSEELRKNVTPGSAEHSGFINFSITRKDDPHELYQMLRVKFQDLLINSSVKINYLFPESIDISNMSVYTMKKFENYHYETIDD